MARVPLPGARVWLRILGYAIAALCGVLLQVLLFPLLAVAGIVPDLLVVLTLWIALREGQVAGTVAGFASGLLLDVVMQGQLGLHAFAKTLAGFVGGFFAHLDDPEWLRALQLWRLSGIFAVGIVVHNLAYFALFVHPLDVPPLLFVLKYTGAATGYTLLLAVLLLLGWRLWERRGLTSAR
ncbi:hypothetical protein HRbin21_00807 [bacterium HR21]|jgi:rod shape-determining protein MreD|nr:hypothetical protein HRbin21_00807 [bacterium HR21]